MEEEGSIRTIVESQPRGLCSVVDASKYLKVSRSMIYLLMDAGELAYVKIGRSRRLRWEELDAYVARHTVAGHSD